MVSLGKEKVLEPGQAKLVISYRNAACVFEACVPFPGVKMLIKNDAKWT